MREAIVLTFLLGLGEFSGAAAPAARVVETRFPPEDVVLANRTLAAPESEGDCTNLNQSALDAVRDEGSGEVFLEAGSYRLKGPLTIPPSVTLRGDYPSDVAKLNKGTPPAHDRYYQYDCSDQSPPPRYSHTSPSPVLAFTLPSFQL